MAPLNSTQAKAPSKPSPWREKKTEFVYPTNSAQMFIYSLQGKLVGLLRSRNYSKIAKVQSLLHFCSFEKQLGSGMSAKVWLVSRNADSSQCVLKVFKTKFLLSSYALENIQVSVWVCIWA